MNLLMLWMMGSSVNLFTFPMLGYMVYSPIMALSSLSTGLKWGPRMCVSDRERDAQGDSRAKDGKASRWKSERGEIAETRTHTPKARKSTTPGPCFVVPMNVTCHAPLLCAVSRVCKAEQG